METNFTVTDFELSDSATYVNMYEYGYGFLNVPNKSTFLCQSSICDKNIFVPNDTPEHPYVGYGWFLRSLQNIRCDETIDMEHLMSKITLEQLKQNNIYIIFSRRSSVTARPCHPNNPVYIGFCKKQH